MYFRVYCIQFILYIHVNLKGTFLRNNLELQSYFSLFVIFHRYHFFYNSKSNFHKRNCKLFRTLSIRIIANVGVIDRIAPSPSAPSIINLTELKKIPSIQAWLVFA